MYPLLVGRDKGFGGAELDLRTLGRSLAADPGFRVTVLTQTTDANPPATSDGMQIKTMPPRPQGGGNPLVRKAADLNYLRRVLFELLRLNPDIYVTEVASIQALLALIAARVRRKPFVFRFGSDMETGIDTMAGFCFHGSRRLAQQFIRSLPKVSTVIAQTANQAALLKSNFGINAQVIRNAHAIPTHVPGIDARVGVLWIGRADPVKQPELLLQAAERLPEIPFTFVLAPGKGYEQLSAHTEARARSLSNVRFIPGVPQSETAALFQAARVLVMTSKAEGLPNVLIEALKYGCPPATLNTNPDQLLAELPEMENIPVAPGFCTAGSMENLGLIIGRLCTDDALWSACSAAAVRVARDNFDIDSIMADYRKLFTALSK